MLSRTQFLSKVKKYFRENVWASFILIFQMLLFVCAFSFILGNSVLAEGFAVLAYFSLIIGILQLIFFEKRRA